MYVHILEGSKSEGLKYKVLKTVEHCYLKIQSFWHFSV